MAVSVCITMQKGRNLFLYLKNVHRLRVVNYCIIQNWSKFEYLFAMNYCITQNSGCKWVSFGSINAQPTQPNLKSLTNGLTQKQTKD